MAIASEDDSLDLTVPVAVGNGNTITTPIGNEYKTATLVDKDTTLDMMLPYIEGFDWVTEAYYNAIRAEDDLISNIDVQAPGSLQQYARITKLVLKVQDPITSTTTEDITGSALVIGSVIPVVEDLFVVRLAGNRPALMRVTQVDRNVYNLEDIFVISYSLDSFIDTNPTRYNDLEEKVVKDLYYDDNYIATESSPILLKSSYETKKLVEKTLYSIPEYYGNLCMDHKTRLLLVPNNNLLDIELIKFFYDITDITNSPTLARASNIFESTVDEDMNNIYSFLINKDLNSFELCKRNIDIIKFNPNIRGRGFGSSDNQTLLPLKYLNIDGVFTYTDDASTGALKTIARTHGDKYINVIPDINTITTYLFSDNFYDNKTDDVTSLEKMLLAYMNNESLVDSDLNNLIESYKFWTDLEKYFYIPFLILLMKYRIHGMNDVIYRN